MYYILILSLVPRAVTVWNVTYRSEDATNHRGLAVNRKPPPPPPPPRKYNDLSMQFVNEH